MNFVEKFTLTQLITNATRVTKNSATLIDHIYTSLGRDMISGGVIKYGLTDHDMIYAIIRKVQVAKPETESFTCRDLRYYTLEYLEMQLELCDWQEYFVTENPNRLWELLYSNYIKCLEIIAPFTTLNKVKPKKTWVNTELLHLIRKRDDYKSKADQLLQNDSFKEFKKLKGRVKRETIRAKREFIMGKIRNAQKDPKKYWKELNDVFVPANKSKEPEIKLNDELRQVSSDQTANFMNDYIANVGRKLAQMIDIDNTGYLDSLKTDVVRDVLIAWRPTNIEEIELLIDSIDISKSSRIEGINTAIFKDCLNCTKKHICYLFNKVLSHGIFPDVWKIAHIIPLHKNGKRDIVSNYRPISLLPLIGKLMEKLMHTRIYNYLQTKHFFTDSQCGFRPQHSTNHAIGNILNYIFNHQNNNTPTLAIYFDLSKAFDTIDHKILLIKLEQAGLKGTCLKLLTNYLTNRQQRCKVNNQLSISEIITYGVPQGSTLGPLLFIIFINDLVNYIEKVKISLYADDTAFYLADSNLEKLHYDMYRAADDFNQWCGWNRLTLNKSKCKTMLYTTNKKIDKSKLSVRIDQNALEMVHEFKYLGVILDSNLSFESHIKMLKQKINAKLYTLKRVRWTLTMRDAKALYKSSILPYIDQGSIFYGNARKDTLGGLQTLQNSCLRTIYGKKNWPGINMAHHEMNLFTTNKRRLFNLMVYTHELSYNPRNMKPVGKRTLRSSTKKYLKLEPPKTSAYKKSFVYIGITVWNNMCEEIKSIKNIKHYKTRVKSELKLNNLNFPE